MKRKNEIIGLGLIATIVISILMVVIILIVKVSGNSSISMPNFGHISEIFSSNSNDELEPIEANYEEVKYYPYQSKDGKWGYVDEDINVVLEAKFDYAKPFSEGIGLVELDGDYSYIDKEGNFLFNKSFAKGESFQGGVAIVTQYGDEDRETYVINHDGEKLCNIDEDSFITNFYDGIGIVSNENRYRYMDTKGNFSEEYDYCRDFKNGVSIADNRDKYYLVGKNGKRIINEGFEFIDSSDSTYFICKNGEEIIVVDNKGNKIDLPVNNSDDVLCIEEGFIFIEKGGKTVFKDYSGAIEFELNDYFIYDSMDDCYLATKYSEGHDEVVCINNKGEEVVNYTALGYTDIDMCFGEVNILKAGSDKYLVDKMGNKIGDKLDGHDKEYVKRFGQFIIVSKYDGSNTKLYSINGKLILSVDGEYDVKFDDVDSEDKVVVLYNYKTKDYITVNLEGKIAE